MSCERIAYLCGTRTHNIRTLCDNAAYSANRFGFSSARKKIHSRSSLSATGVPPHITFITLRTMENVNCLAKNQITNRLAWPPIQILARTHTNVQFAEHHITISQNNTLQQTIIDVLLISWQNKCNAIIVSWEALTNAASIHDWKVTSWLIQRRFPLLTERTFIKFVLISIHSAWNNQNVRDKQNFVNISDRKIAETQTTHFILNILADSDSYMTIK